MKRLDIVTVLENGEVLSPGIVLEVGAGGDHPLVTAVAVLRGGSAHPFRDMVYSGTVLDAAYTWREYSADDFPAVDTPAAPTEPEAASSSDTGGKAETPAA